MVTLGKNQDMQRITGTPDDLPRWAMGAVENILHDVDSLYEEKDYTLRNIFAATKGMLGEAAHSIAASDKPIIRIITGFYIEKAGAAETDGPSAAAQLAYFFKQVGIECCVVTDRYCSKVCHAALHPVKCADSLEVIQEGTEKSIERIKNKWIESGVSHVISIERPAASWGNRDIACNMRNEPLKNFFHLDQLFYTGNDTPWTSIGIGDRGNEMGLGALPVHIIANDIPHGDKIASRIGCEFPITSRVSNWAANGLLAGLGVLGDQNWVTCAKKALDPDLMKKILRNMWNVGAVDGITFMKKPKRISVDALPMCKHTDKANAFLQVLRVCEQGMRQKSSSPSRSTIQELGHRGSAHL